MTMEEIHNPKEFRLGQELLREGLISEAQLKTALEYQRSLGGRLHEIIGKLGFVDEKPLNEFVARSQHMHTIDVSGRVIDEELLRRIPREVIERHEVIPFRQSDDSILLAMSEAMDYQAIEEIQFLTSCKIETALAPRSQVLAAITRFYDEHPDVDASAAPATPPAGAEAPEETDSEADLETGSEADLEADSEARSPEELVSRISDPTVAALARALLKSGAIDISAWEDELEKT